MRNQKRFVTFNLINASFINDVALDLTCTIKLGIIYFSICLIPIVAKLKCWQCFVSVAPNVTLYMVVKNVIKKNCFTVAHSSELLLKFSRLMEKYNVFTSILNMVMILFYSFIPKIEVLIEVQKSQKEVKGKFLFFLSCVYILGFN